jgi:hypothetical protein
LAPLSKPEGAAIPISPLIPLNVPHIAHASELTCHTEPVMCPAPMGRLIVSKTLSIAQYLHDQQLRELFEGPLSDSNSDEDIGDNGSPTNDPLVGGTDGPSHPPALDEGYESRSSTGFSNGTGCLANPPSPLLTKKEKDRMRSAARRRKKRLAQQAAMKIKDKRVTRKRRLDAAKDAIYVDYHLPSAAHVTKPGWIGKRIGNLPRRLFTLEELIKDYNMRRFPWDGR